MWQFLEWLRSHGLNESAATAGLMGGTVRGLIIQGGWRNGFVSCIVGGLTANYMSTSLALSSLNYLNWSEGSIGFVIGMTAMIGCEIFMKKIGDKISALMSGSAAQ